MKTKFFIPIALLSFSTFLACEEDQKTTPDLSTITGYDKEELVQDVYADETSTESTFSFEAAADWKAEIVADTKSETSWVRVNPAKGSKGSVEMTIQVEENFSGEERSSTIMIRCGESELPIEITQKATTESGELPDTQPILPKKIASAKLVVDGVESVNYQFSYDEEGRLSTIGYTFDEEGYGQGYTQTTTYDYTELEQGTVLVDTEIVYPPNTDTNGDGIVDDKDETTFTENGTVRMKNGSAVLFKSQAEGMEWIRRELFAYDEQGYLLKSDYNELGEDDYHEDFTDPVEYITNNGNLEKYTWGVGTEDEEILTYKQSEHDNNLNLDIIRFFVSPTMINEEMVFANLIGKRYRKLPAEITMIDQGGSDVIAVEYKKNAEGYITEFGAMGSHVTLLYEE